jgi:hypothetical protein
MKIAIKTPIEDFISSPLLLQHYSERQLVATYELLLGDFGPKVLELLTRNNLVKVTIEPEEVKIGWQTYYEDWHMVEVRE